MRRVLRRIFKIGIKVLWGYDIGRFYPVRVTYKLLWCLLRTDVVEVFGHKMFLDREDSLRLSVGEVHDPPGTELIKKEIKKGDIVLDIGANIGYFTLLFAKLVGKEGKVFAFEPDPDNFSLLEKNVKLNGYQNVILIRGAVSSETGKIRLYLSEENKADNRIYNSGDSRRSIEVEAIRLDDYFESYEGEIDFIKMDIQGAEAKAIQGMPLLLQKNRSIKLLTEFWPFGLTKSGVEPEVYLNLLTDYHFELYDIKRKKTKKELAGILQTYTYKKQNSTNLFCVKCISNK